MATLQGPLFSLHASGTLRGGLNYATLRGQAYARKNPLPRQPNTPPQVSLRAMYSFLAQQWPLLDPAWRASWETLDAPAHLSAYNRFLSFNLKRWQQFLTPIASLDSPPAPNYPFFYTLVATAGVRHVHLATVNVGPGPIWGHAFFHHTRDWPTPYQTELFRVLPAGFGFPAGDAAQFDHHTTPGTHYYTWRIFGHDGSHFWSDPSASATATDQ